MNQKFDINVLLFWGFFLPLSKCYAAFWQINDNFLTFHFFFYLLSHIITFLNMYVLVFLCKIISLFVLFFFFVLDKLDKIRKTDFI